MRKQIIVAISREYGSGGHYIADKLSESLGIQLLDRNILDKLGEKMGLDMSVHEQYDEVKKNPFMSRVVRGMSNSPEENLAEMQFDYILEKADKGESMIVVGRCADHILKGNPSLITIFITGDKDAKRKRVMKVRNMNEREAARAMLRHDRKRRAYHNNYAETKWGDSRHYDICINSSKLGLDATVELLRDYLVRRMEM